MRQIDWIVIHCTAGYSNIPSIQKFWKEKLKWKSNGYHIIVQKNGVIWYINSDNNYSTNIDDFDISKICNGVKCYNSNSVHISYIGGVKEEDYTIAEDTRTIYQKNSIKQTIYKVLEIVQEYQEIKNIQILGHRDLSKDINGNGIIDSWERIKECPSFNAIPEYKHILNNFKGLPNIL